LEAFLPVGTVVAWSQVGTVGAWSQVTAPGGGGFQDTLEPSMGARSAVPDS
jgi:hypothetical protein